MIGTFNSRPGVKLDARSISLKRVAIARPNTRSCRLATEVHVNDIAVRRGNFSFYFPLATSIILSVLLTLLLAFFRR